MKPRTPKLTAILVILVLAVPLFLVPSAAAPTAQARMGDVKTANDVYASKINAKLAAAVATAAWTRASTSWSMRSRDGSEPLPGQTDRAALRDAQRHAGLLRPDKGRQVGKIASLAEVAYVQEMKYPGDLPQPPEGPQVQRPDPATLKAKLTALKAKVDRHPAGGGQGPHRRLVRRAGCPQVQGGLGPGLHGRRRQGHGQRLRH